MSTLPESNARDVADRMYQEIVRRLADGGDDPEVTELRAALAGVGASNEQLLADVEQKRQDRLELESLRVEQREVAEQQYTDLVHAAADGLELDTISAEAILSAARRSPEDFIQDLRKLTGVRQRRTFSEMVWQAKFDDVYRNAQQTS
jgi:hypothetical protein